MVKKQGGACGYVHNKFTSALESVQIVVYRIYVPPQLRIEALAFFLENSDAEERRIGATTIYLVV